MNNVKLNIDLGILVRDFRLNVKIMFLFLTYIIPANNTVYKKRYISN